MAKRIIPHKVFKTKEDFHHFIANEKEWMFTRIVDSIEISFRQGALEACIFEAKIEEAGTLITMNSDIEDWRKSLSLALAWNEKQERYEECAKIQGLIRDITTYLE